LRRVHVELAVGFVQRGRLHPGRNLDFGLQVEHVHVVVDGNMQQQDLLLLWVRYAEREVPLHAGAGQIRRTKAAGASSDFRANLLVVAA